jgi:4,5-DOPA dioxygenase extradiol
VSKSIGRFKMVEAIFISHGSPTLLIEDGEYVELLKKLGREYKSKGIDLIMVSSPHWISHEDFYVQVSPKPPCIQDYYGFPDELYQFKYEVENDLDFALKLVEESKRRNFHVEATLNWGLDHGAWVPLYFMFPERDIPVVPISTSAGQLPEAHFRWGKFIREFAESFGRKVLFIGTGSTTHRLDMIRWGMKTELVYPPGEKFDRHLLELIRTGKYDEVLRLPGKEIFYSAMPEGGLLTLFLTLGVAGEGTRGEILYYGGWAYGVSMTAIKFLKN